jgi:hypothetical protein
VPLRSENSLRQLRHRTKRMSLLFPVIRMKRTFPPPRLPESAHEELTQHRSETSVGMAPLSCPLPTNGLRHRKYTPCQLRI